MGRSVDGSWPSWRWVLRCLAPLVVVAALAACGGAPSPPATTPAAAAEGAVAPGAAAGPGTPTGPGLSPAAPSAGAAPHGASSGERPVERALGPPRVGAPLPSSRQGEPVDDRAPRRDLAADERRGGHTLDRHVAKTDDELRARLDRERQISAASTFPDRLTAEIIVAAALAQHAQRVETWADRDGSRPNLVLDYDGPRSRTIGRTMRRGARRADPCTDATVVLRWDDRRKDFYVLTSYPEQRR